MAHLWEMHFHTAETSPCGSVAAGEAVKAYQQQGYEGIVVTDHYTRYWLTEQEGSWTGKVKKWLRGYDSAREAGEVCGLTVLLGMELRLDGGSNEYLVYGITPEHLITLPGLYRMSEKNLRAMARTNGWFVAQAHPCRPHMTIGSSAHLDGMEIYNGNKRHQSHNDEAAAICREADLTGISGSDFHEWEDLARGGVNFQDPVTSMDDLLYQLNARTFTIRTTV